jgi:hypothetical protein
MANNDIEHRNKEKDARLELARRARNELEPNQKRTDSHVADSKTS